MSEVVLRVARIDDSEAIGSLHVRSWQAAYAGRLPAAVLDKLSPSRRAATWRDTIARQAANPAAGRTWVIEQDRAVVGFAEAGRARDDDMPAGSGEVHAIYLAPEAWSQGLGGRLFDHAVDDLVAGGFDPLVLWVLAENERARQFYERRGWLPDGSCRTLDFDGTPVDELRYRWVRPSPDR